MNQAYLQRMRRERGKVKNEKKSLSWCGGYKKDVTM